MDQQKLLAWQKQTRNDVKTLHSYMTDLQNWEVEMKRKEAALKGEFEQELPPVRSKIKKEKPVVPVKKKKERRIASSDYTAWDKFDVDSACDKIDMEEVGPTSLDSKKSSFIKQEKLKEEAQYEKTKGNNFVKLEKWDEAISCYNRAIELVNNDAIFYANRGLCYLKKDNLHLAEKDCTKALSIDPNYVKALQRRATASEKLGSLRSASHDLLKVLELEPHNAAARKQLLDIKARMGTKGSKSKSSPSSTPTIESRPIGSGAKIVELNSSPPPTKPTKVIQIPNKALDDEKWKNGVGENITVIKPVKKPPHLRSKRALKPVLIKEVKHGESEVKRAPVRIQIIEVDDEKAHGDTNNNDKHISNESKIVFTGDGDVPLELTNGINPIETVESVKLEAEIVSKEKTDGIKNNGMPEKTNDVKNNGLLEKNIGSLVPPVNSVQFMTEWKNLKGYDNAKCHYLSLIDPNKIPSIFANALESDVLSEILKILQTKPDLFKEKTITAYLKGLVNVKRFSALAMFLSGNDKKLIKQLLDHCQKLENCPESEIQGLENKFEI